MSETQSPGARSPRLGPVIGPAWLVLLLLVGRPFAPAAVAQDGAAAEAAAAPAPDSTVADAPGQRTFWETLRAGGVIGFLIILLSLVSLSAIIYHVITIRKERLMPDTVAARLEQLVKEGEVDEAIEYCRERKPESLLTDVVLAGLLRYKASEFGDVEYRAAVEEEGEEQTAKLYRQTEVLAVIGAIAPMLGLLGTVQGMIEAFNTIASTGGMAKPSDLADAISKALVTTLEGLVVAIPTMVALSIFRTRIDGLVAEAGKRVEQILLPLGRHKK